jgi:hypothetical protein
LLVVGFDPAMDPLGLAAFRSRYAVPTSVPVYGPYSGKLDNAGERLELLKPDPPSETGSPGDAFVPLVLVDKVDYSDAPPWPADGVDGGGLSLQRRNAAAYGNDPTNWLAAVPTPGWANGSGVVAPPVITQSPQSQTVTSAAPASFSVGVSGASPLHCQWRFNGFDLPGETNATLVLEYVLLENEGDYDVFAGNPGGSAFSAAARLQVNAPPSILQPPENVSTGPGSNVLFTVGVSGSAPLYYQWRFNGRDIPAATSSSLFLPNAGLEHAGLYTVVVSNRFGVTSASATLLVLAKPVFTLHPISQTAVLGGTVALSVAAIGTPPMHFRWRRTGTNVTNAILLASPTNSTLVLTNVQPADAGNYTVVATNIPGAAVRTGATAPWTPTAME